MPESTLSNGGRLRPHPEERFAARQIPIDLKAAAAKLRAESPAGERGHRQVTLYRQGGLTIALFVFERFTHLDPHRAKGVVNIQVLRGKLKITAGNQVHELGGAADVEHSVSAEEESEMLLTVRLGS